MGLLSRLFSRPPSGAAERRPLAAAGHTFTGFDDPAFKEYVRTGGASSRISVSVTDAMRNTAVLRCVDLVSGAIGMLPLYLMRREASGKKVPAEDHPLFDILMHEPNSWQTPSEFKRTMQAWALVHGNAYAIKVRSRGQISQLIPIHPDRVTVDQMSDWSLVYRVTRADGAPMALPSSEILHIRDLSLDAITGISRVKQAAEIISLALQANTAAERIFRNGMMVGGALTHKDKLSPEAFDRLKASMQERYQGAENAGRWMVLEEGMEAKPFASTGKDAQLVEMRSAQVEEIARAFGVPRPLMGVDDTSWGSGIEQLAILFVRFALAPWFKAWEEAISRACLDKAERRAIVPEFDETELLRGTLKDQAEFFARALGAGGHRPWMEVNEVREVTGLGVHPQGSGLIAAGETADAQPPSD